MARAKTTAKKAVGKKRQPGAAFLSTMQVPPDLAYRESVLTFYGGREVYIENYRRILEYEDGRIRILTRNGTLNLEGRGLQIRYYSNEEMKITGEIQRIQFDP